MPFYAFTVFLGAFLLFQIQPLMGRYLLPWFGGGPGVWTTCLCFFQVTLLAGYAYAHALARYGRPRGQMLIHLVLLLAALACLPIVPSESCKPAGSDHPAGSIGWLLATKIGLPCLVLASTGPLVQYWLGCERKSPYWLYALSNLGSLLALITYPFVFEVYWPLRSQARFWSWGLVFYGLVSGCCAVLAARRRPAATGSSLSARHKNVAAAVSAAIEGGIVPPGDKPQSADRRLFSGLSAGQDARLYGRRDADRYQRRWPSTGQRAQWLLWSACGSVLLMATTNKLCLDVAVFPLLWVLPLSFYLLSFIICFSGPRTYWRLPITLGLGLAVAGLCWALFDGASWPFSRQVCIYTGGLFVCCLVCHGELYRIRPPPQALTEFYLMVAFGGALGGLFVSLAAPAIFTNYFELHWGLLLLGLLLVAVRTPECIRTVLEKAADGLTSSAGVDRTGKSASNAEWTRLGLASLWLALFALAAVLWLQARQAGASILHQSRNFYGVLTVFDRRADEPNGHHVLLRHGRITHGLQFVNPQLQGWPTTYYGPDSGIGLALNARPAGHRRVGVVGLGIGTLASYAQEGDYFHFYEINPEVSCLATSRFSNLAQCRGNWDVTLGDARLSLEREPPQRYDVLALDAFNSDSIPVHLLTREAFETYLRHLNPNGVLAIHTSNHFLNLEGVVDHLAWHFGLQSAVIDHEANPDQWWIYSSTWVLISRDPHAFDSPKLRAAVKAAPASPKPGPLWTDDFSSLFSLLR